MATAAVNPILSAGISLGDDLAEVAARLREVTVQVLCGPGCGSGVIWRPDGLIVTNAHVAQTPHPAVLVGGAGQFDAEVIAVDRRRDLAALKIRASGLRAAKVRDPVSLRAGELVVAVGNPAGMAGALAVGMVHAPQAGRAWIQADIRLAPGNSDGPLADAHGNVLGINSMVVAGLALAIPANRVQRFVDRLTI